jgi:hypothetical protein
VEDLNSAGVLFTVSFPLKRNFKTVFLDKGTEWLNILIQGRVYMND